MSTDWSGWPLVSVNAADRGLDEGRHLLLDTLQLALARAEGFAVVVVLPDRAGPSRPDGTEGRPAPARGVVQRLRGLRPDLQVRCRGIAFVIGAEPAVRARKVIRVGSVIMGCPTAAEGDVAAGRRWAVERLAAAGQAAPGGTSGC